MVAKEWIQGFKKWITANLGNINTDELSVDDSIIVFKENAAANQYDRVTSIQELIDLIEVSTGLVTSVSSLSTDQLLITDGSTQPKLTIVIGEVEEDNNGLVTGDKVYDAINLNTLFNGNRLVTRNGIPNVNVGGTTIKEFLENYFFPFVNATISINNVASVYEVGMSVTLSYVGSVTLNDESGVHNGRIMKLSPIEEEAYNFGTAEGYNVGIGGQTNIVPATYTTRVETTGDDEGVTVYSSIRYQYFVYPYLYGVNAADISTGGTIGIVLTNLVERTGTKAVTLTGTGYIYYAFSASYGDLTSIKDHNGFEQLSSFTKTTANVTSVGKTIDWTTSYKIYKLNSTTAPSGWTYTFEH